MLISGHRLPFYAYKAAVTFLNIYSFVFHIRVKYRFKRIRVNTFYFYLLNNLICICSFFNPEMKNKLIFTASASTIVPTVCNGREVVDSTTSSLWIQHKGTILTTIGSICNLTHPALYTPSTPSAKNLYTSTPFIFLQTWFTEHVLTFLQYTVKLLFMIT